MTADQSAVVVERHVAAAPSTVYAYFTDSDRWARWQGAHATIEARPGGPFRMVMGNGMCARGQFVELVPDKRVVFTGDGSTCPSCRRAPPSSRSTSKRPATAR